jgi:hypothetical protein
VKKFTEFSTRMSFTYLCNPESFSKDLQSVHRVNLAGPEPVAGGGLAEAVPRVRDAAQVRSFVAGGSLYLLSSQPALPIESVETSNE